MNIMLITFKNLNLFINFKRTDYDIFGENGK